MYVIGIAGPPGSGKSTFADRLAALLGAAVAPMDGFHLPNAELERRDLRERKGAPETFDKDGFVDALRRLRGGEPVAWPIYDRSVHEPVDGPLITSEIVVTEGNYLLHWPEVRPLLDVCWFLSVPDTELRERLLGRHVSTGRSTDEARLKIDNDLANARLVNATAGRADLTIGAS